MDKLRNTIELDYPSEKLEIIVVSDGSRDDTAEKARTVGLENLSVYEIQPNRGKSCAQNFGVEHAKGDIVILTDVDSVLDRGFIRNIIPCFADTNVACVGGVAMHRLEDKESDISRSHGVHVRLEQFIRKAESSFGMLITLAGWGFAIRRTDFVPLDHDTGDDTVLPMEMTLRGKRSVIAPGAFVTDSMPSSLKGELKARTRITLRNLTALMRRKALLNPIRFPRVALAAWSHRLLRWFNPVLMLIMFFSCLWLSLTTEGSVYDAICIGQLIVYALGIGGIAATINGIKIPFTGYLSSFLLANYGFLLGLYKFVVGQRIRSYSNS